MPAEFFFDEGMDRGLEDEMDRWRVEFQLRDGRFDIADHDDMIQLASNACESPEEAPIKELTENVISFKQSDFSETRLGMLNATIDNMAEVNRHGELPEGFIQQLAHEATEYVNGFLPNQEVATPSTAQFASDDADNIGSHYFIHDKVELHPKGRSIVSRGTSAVVTLGHEVLHKNNTEAILEDPESVRNLSWIYRNEVPESYTDTVGSSEVAPVKQSLLGGLSLLKLDNEHNVGILDAYIDNSMEDLDFREHEDEFSEAVAHNVEKLDLKHYDTRDEAIATAFSYFVKGKFDRRFNFHLVKTQKNYNEKDQYSDEAGDMIAGYLEDIREEYDHLEGLKGPRFRQVMENRIPFLKGNYEFGH